MRAVLSGLAAVLAMASVSSAQPKQSTSGLAYGDRLDPFRDIKAVSVLVEEIPAVLKGIVSEDALKAAVELKLRHSGLTVEAGSWGTPHVYVNLNAMRAAEDVVVHSLELQFNRQAAIRVVSAKEDRIVQGTWWSRSLIGIARNADAAAGIRSALEQLTELFLNDWRAANPVKR
jgi:hypothetical protein